MFFIDLLDSAYTANPIKTTKDWWRPKSEIVQRIAIDISHASMMMSLLHGETVTLSNNQAMDSTAWLEATKYFYQFPRLEWAPAAVTFFGAKSKPSPDALVELVIKNLKDEKFVLSAWVGLDSKIRLTIAGNLEERKLPFYKMLEGSGVDPETKDLLLPYAVGLQRFHDYLLQWETRRDEVCFSPQPSSGSLWENLTSLKDKQYGISANSLSEIERYITSGKDIGTAKTDLNRRGELYNALGAIDIDEKLRDDARSFVDLFYHHQVAMSTAGSRGLFTSKNLNTPASIADQIGNDEAADSVNSKRGIMNYVNIHVIPKAAVKVSGLTWEKVEKFLSDPDFRLSAIALQDRRVEVQRDPSSETNQKRLKEQLQKHQELLSHKLSQEIVSQSGKIEKTAGNWTAVTLGFVETISFFVSFLAGIAATNGSPYVGLFGGALGAAIVETLKPGIAKAILDETRNAELGNVAGRVRNELKEAVKLG